MKDNFKKSTVVITLIAIIFVQLLVRTYVGSQKEYFHMDEAYSYSLMNYDKIQITENEDFYNNWHDKSYYIDFLSINQNEVWNFLPVYENQKNDVHPPLYYVLLRIAASFTIDSFTKWTGIILNMIIFVFSSVFIYLIGNRIFKNKKMALFTCFITGLTLGALDTTAYIRMYELANLFVLIITYLHMKIYDKDELKMKDLIPIGITALAASLTHYYTIFYMIVLFVIFAIKYIKKKQYKNLAKYVVTFAVAAILSIAIFPYSINHMFGGYRGEGAKSNLLNMDTFFQDMGQCMYIVEKGITNNLILIFAVIYIILKQKLKNNKEGLVEKLDCKEVCLIYIPTIFYFVLIAKMSPYKELRYFMPIISVATIYMIYVFYKLFRQTLKPKTANIAIVSMLIIMIISPIITKTNLEFTYTKMNHLAEKMEEKSNLPALYILNENNIRFLDDIYIFTKINDSYIMGYTKATIENIENVLSQKDTSNGIIFICNEGVSHEEIVKQIMEKFGYTQNEYVQRLNAGDVIYLH